MKLEDILEKVVTLATIIFIGWGVYSFGFKKDDTPVQQQGQYSRDDYQKQQKESEYNKIRQWLNEHESEARKTAVDFILKKGYSIQSIKLTQKDASNRTSVSFTTSGMLWAYYQYDVVTDNTSQNGSLVYITITVKYDKPKWYVDYFHSYII